MNTQLRSKGKIFGLALLIIIALGFSSTQIQAADEETEATIAFNAGNLELISAPTLAFGTQDISATDQTYTTESITDDIIVHDLRGNFAGWNLTASLSAFNLDSIGTDKPTLSGAYLTVKNQNVVPINNDVSIDPVPNENLVLTAGGAAQRVLTAAKDSGTGAWKSEWSNENTVLTVLSGTEHQGTSYAVISWNMQDTP